MEQVQAEGVPVITARQSEIINNARVVGDINLNPDGDIQWQPIADTHIGDGASFDWNAWTRRIAERPIAVQPVTITATVTIPEDEE